jgi:hypothetical protein
MPPSDRNSTDELELPPLDGAGDDDELPAVDDDVSIRNEEDPYDDAAGDDADLADAVEAEDEPSAVGDDDVGFAEEDGETMTESPVAGTAAGGPVQAPESMLGDEDAPGTVGEDFGLVEGGDAIRDGGEEGFDAPEPELRVEDLPRLDEGDDDDLTVEEAADDVLAPLELRWDDRGFERIRAHALGHVVRIRLHGGVEVALEDGSVLRSVDDGKTFSAADHEGDEDEALVVRGRVRALLRDGAGVLRAVDDGPLVLVESTAEASAFTVLDDGSLVVAIESRLVRVGIDGTSTLVAEEESAVEALASDAHTGLVWSGGAYGLVAYKPR